MASVNRNKFAPVLEHTCSRTNSSFGYNQPYLSCPAARSGCSLAALTQTRLDAMVPQKLLTNARLHGGV